MCECACLHIKLTTLCHVLVSVSFETLPWACRYVEYGSTVEVLGTKEVVDVACHPFAMTAPACSVLTQLLSRGEARPVATSTSSDSTTSSTTASSSRSSSDNLPPELLPHFQPCPNQLAITLMNINSVWHPCITYGRFHSWNGYTPFTAPLPFYEGVDDFTAQILDSVSNEVLAIKAALLQHHPHLNLDRVRHVSDWLLSAYDHQIADKTSLRTRITTNRAYAGIMHPMVPAPVGATEEGGGGSVPNTAHRFWVEDLPCGMVATRGIAELAGVDTPTIDTVILVRYWHFIASF